MRVGVIGINHKLADLRLRELLAKACQKRFGSTSYFHGNQRFVILSTCNRTEIYFYSEDLTDTHTYLLSLLKQETGLDDFDQKLYSFFGYDCFVHLARVTAGLDSAIVAETEIQGQVKAAYEAVQTSLPKELHFIFQKALKVGKQVRTQLTLGRGMPDLEHAILGAGRNLFSSLEDARVLFVGTSVINLKIMEFFLSKEVRNITICNRSETPRQAIAQKYGISQLSWPQLQEWTSFDWIILGTKSPDYLIQKTEQSLPASKLVVDLCVPRNVDPKLALHPSITLLNIDQINRMLKFRRQKMLEDLSRAETLVQEAIRQHTYLYKTKEAYLAAV